jgi:hypothetical protein
MPTLDPKMANGLAGAGPEMGAKFVKDSDINTGFSDFRSSLFSGFTKIYIAIDIGR